MPLLLNALCAPFCLLLGDRLTVMRALSSGMRLPGTYTVLVAASGGRMNGIDKFLIVLVGAWIMVRALDANAAKQLRSKDRMEVLDVVDSTDECTDPLNANDLCQQTHESLLTFSHTELDEMLGMNYGDDSSFGSDVETDTTEVYAERPPADASNVLSHNGSISMNKMLARGATMATGYVADDESVDGSEDNVNMQSWRSFDTFFGCPQYVGEASFEQVD